MWLDSDLYNMDIQIDCGPIIVEFFNIDLTPLDQDIFYLEADQHLCIEEIDDVTKKGDYEILYRITLERYQMNFVESTEPFIVTIEDPCDNPRNVIPSIVETQEYTITQKAF